MLDYLFILVKFFIPFLLGGLFFFAALVAPNVFKSLDEKNSRLFLRGIFPKLYLYSGILSLLISLNLFFINNFLSFMFFIITLGYFYSRQYLMIRINKASDQKNQKEFKKLHRFSVLIFITQILLMILIFLVL
ncbi:MAG: hypothetical protein CMM92_02780 [Rickettsiales bacterium]|nr:hypothetical protein [Rickettsiales bacterium]RPG14886.1 MAG: DUF4149 domain-containing protein [Pelagibacteraceae bacterium TMED195]|tara:strand:- start:3595 stop:3993 length:399 start_codon:yes stop_codon:yes gene_type:complete